MRVHTLCLALVALTAVAPAVASSQKPPGSSQVAQTTRPTLDQPLRHDISQLGESIGIDVPPADSFALGGRTIATGATVNGTVAAANGPVEVSGRVNGNVIALHGDVVVHRGGSISGDAVSVGGHVIVDGGHVSGEMRSLSGLTTSAGSASVAASAPRTTWGSMKLVVGWFTVLLFIGIGVMIFAEHNLDGVVAVLERHLARAFWVGLLAELGLVPLLLVAVAALAITVIGILLIPFLIVAYIIAASGLLALGFLAVARFTGRGFFKAHPGDAPRSVNLRALLIGLVLYLGVWFVVAALTWLPVAEPVLRAIALAVTWVALTAGLGATVLSRAGTQHEKPRDSAVQSGAGELVAWATPTPVAGVAAARRPVAASRETQ